MTPSADQVAAFELDVAADVTSEQVVERRPPQQRAQHARARDPDAGAVGSGPTERDRRAVPQPQRKRHIERLREMLEDAAGTLRRSIKARQDEALRLGEDPGHRTRINDEQRLLRQIEKALRELSSREPK